MRKEVVLTNFTVLARVCLHGLRKTKKALVRIAGLRATVTALDLPTAILNSDWYYIRTRLNKSWAQFHFLTPSFRHKYTKTVTRMCKRLLKTYISVKIVVNLL
jgi:hypothetical protein